MQRTYHKTIVIHPHTGQFVINELPTLVLCGTVWAVSYTHLVPVLIGGGEKALECGLNDGSAWIVRSNNGLLDGKMRTVDGNCLLYTSRGV